MQCFKTKNSWTKYNNALQRWPLKDIFRFLKLHFYNEQIDCLSRMHSSPLVCRPRIMQLI
jgi:hypothetical protein